MKHISLDHEDERIKVFVRSLEMDADGSMLELDGRAVARILPPVVARPDTHLIEAAILNRRDESRRENAEWEALDREVWDATDGES